MSIFPVAGRSHSLCVVSDIADVSHFVHPDNPMDSEAASRGTTVYLVDKRIDMLPSLLGTNLCSLRPFVERLAFSAIWELTPEGEIVSTRFTKSVIASKEAFTYQAAQDRKDDKSLQDPLTQGIRLLNTLAIKLKEGRMRAGALSLSSPELKIHLDTNEGAPEPIDVEQKQSLETNSLVEEFMLLANISVAKKIQEAYPQTAVLRRHLPPPKTNFETLQDILQKKKGMTLDVTSSKALAESLDHCVVSIREVSFREYMLIHSQIRFHPNRNSTPWCESWQLDVCLLQSTSAQEVSQRILSAITVSPAPSIPISL